MGLSLWKVLHNVPVKLHLFQEVFKLYSYFVHIIYKYITSTTFQTMLSLGGYPGEGGKLAKKDLNASVLIPFNDDPFGVFAIAPESLEHEVAEDVLLVNDMFDVTSFTILRQQGTFGDVRVAWEILSGAFPRGLPPMEDLILIASFPQACRAPTTCQETPCRHRCILLLWTSRSLWIHQCRNPSTGSTEPG